MNTKNASIFTSLVKKYITFVIIVIISIIIAYAFIILQISISSRNGQVPKINPSDIVRSDYENIYSKDIESFHGWIEILDENMNVIYIKGEKKDTYKSYSENDLVNILNMDSHNKYLGLLEPFKSQDGRSLFCLVKYPSDAFNLQFNIKKGPYQTGSIIYNNLIKGALFFLLLCIINIILYSKWTSKKINLPLVKITDGITKMAHGDYSAKIDFKAEKEFAVIRDSFNSMVDKLRKAEEYNIKLQQDKTRMLMDLSHDIKTPISTIQCFSKALSEDLINDEEKKYRYYNTIYAKCEKVSNLIDTLFEFVKLESIDYKPIMKKSDFCEFIRRLITEFYDEFEEEGFILELLIPEDELIIAFDEKLLNRAISNILSNALKYNPSETKLRIEIKEDPNAAILEIGDTGTGIPNRLKDTIFEPFVRGDEARKSDGGTGLGLAIVKKIIEKHNGRLELYNNVNDEKTTFVIYLNKNG